MKKLMIVAAIVCAAAMSQAATYSWAASDSSMWGEAGNYDYPKIAQGTVAYFAFVDAYSQSELVADYAAGTVNFAKFATGANSTVNASGGVSQSADFTAAYTTAQQAYFAIFEAATGNLFISTEATAGYLEVGTKPVSFASQTDISDWELNPVKMASDGYTSAGWYQAAAVPEPTSGLLLLLGIAGLALKRTRA